MSLYSYLLVPIVHIDKSAALPSLWPQWVRFRNLILNTIFSISHKTTTPFTAAAAMHQTAPQSNVYYKCCFWRNLLMPKSVVFFFPPPSLQFSSWFRLLCPNHSWAEQTQHHGGDPVLDGTWSGDTESVWAQSGYLVAGDNGHRDDRGRAPLPQREPAESKRVAFALRFSPHLLVKLGSKGGTAVSPPAGPVSP